MKASVLHVMNNISPASTEYDLAGRLNEDKFDVHIISFLDIKQVEDSKIINLKARNKMDIGAIRKMDSFMKENNIDILHTHHNISGSIARVLAKKNHIPIIVDTEHGSHSRYKFLGNLFNDSTLFMSNRIVNVSNWVRDSYHTWEKVFISEKRMCVIYNGVNLKKIDNSYVYRLSDDEYLMKYGIKKKDRVFLHVARLTTVKNQYKLIEGFSRILPNYPDTKLIIAGDGELRNDLCKLVGHLKINENVVFTGLIPREDVYNIMKRSDGFVMNSLSEGMCVSLLEAMAFKLPCILSDIPSFRETVRGWDIGEFVKKDSSEEVAGAFERFLADIDGKLKEKGKKARELVERYYNFDNTLAKYEQLYLELLREVTG